MQYTKFKIKNYRGISEEILIDLTRSPLLPIIGINESGKTTILEAIYCFDYLNDENNNGKHLLDLENYYDPLNNKTPFISAEIHGTSNQFHRILSDYLKPMRDSYEQGNISSMELEEMEFLKSSLAERSKIIITRNLVTKQYALGDIQPLAYIDSHDLCTKFVEALPYTLYFDDFRDTIEDFIDVPTSKTDNESKWIPYIDVLLKTSHRSYSIYELPTKAVNNREAIIRSAQKTLQDSLNRNWGAFGLEGEEPLKVELKYNNSNQLEFKIVETITTNTGSEQRFFSVKDRSKGFFWYFNFIMKLEYNPSRRNHEDSDTIYLLDEPGSYLHSTAQSKLSFLLKKLSEKNKVIYCTHSPYLLDPENIPINSILIADKNNKGKITLQMLNESKIGRQNSAFQPVHDALLTKPIPLSYETNNIVLVEGIYDYYLYEIFKQGIEANFFPCTGATNIEQHIPYMIFLGKKYCSLWDNDEKGNEAFKKAEKSFGEMESKKWLVIPLNGKKKRKLEDLIEKVDISLLKEQLNLNDSTPFEKVVVAFYYSNDKIQLLDKISKATKDNFEQVMQILIEKMSNT